MGVGDTLPLPPGKNGREENKPTDIASTSSSSSVSVVNARLSDSPILLFVYFHKAFRAQLTELHRLAGDAVSASSDLAVELRRKLDFLKLVYNYHSAAEDEVIFSALDTRVKNIVFNYSLEHDATEDLFTSIFHWLNVLQEERANISDVIREVVLCIGTIQSSICQHMLKEERQVFPLLIDNFSSQEQASLVWQFICSVPVMVLEEMFPWMTSLLSPKEKSEVENCLKEVVPKDVSLQLVVNSWMIGHSQSSFTSLTKIMKGVQSVEVCENMKNSHTHSSSSGLFQRFWQWSKVSFSSPITGHTLIHGIQLWHNAIKSELVDIRKGLCQLKFPSLSLDLNVLVVRLNFLADVLIFYGNAFEKFFYPVFEDMVDQHTSISKQFTIDGHVKNFKRSLDLKTITGSENFVIMLQEKLESLILTVAKQFSVEETEVFPIISKNCNVEMQRHLLYRSLHVLPLGLLKCVIMWFSAQLSEDESQSIILFLSLEDSFPNKSLAQLLLQWFRFGYSGKTPVESFWNELSFMFRPRCPFEEEHTEEASGSFTQLPQLQQCKGSDPYLLVCPGNKNKSSTCFQSMDLPAGYMNETPYSSAMNQQILIPKNLRPLQQHPDGDKNIGDHIMMDLKPIDLIFFFHKAMKKDLDYLVCGSSRLAADRSFLGEFRQRFHLIKFLYQIHSDAEDEIAFPALEAKGKLQNISQSYSIDHELEVEHLDKVSFLLSEMAELSIINSNVLDYRNVKYEKMCLSLQDICKSIHKLLSEHLHREETELWCLFRNCFAIEEQEKIIACMLGRISGEILQDMIPWLMESLIADEQHVVMSLWRQATRKTMFAEWLTEWYNCHDVREETGEANKEDQSEDLDPLDIVWNYLLQGAADGDKEETKEFLETDSKAIMNKPLGKDAPNNKVEVGKKEENHREISKSKKVSTGADEEQTEKLRNSALAFQMSQKSSKSGQATKYERLLSMSQEDVEATIRRISRDSTLDPSKKSYIMQNLLMSRWIATQRINNLEPSIISSNREAVPGQHPSYRDAHRLIYGCKHYKRSCKILAPCCNQLFTCIRCHDEEADHSVDRKHITKIMCMKCMIIQPVGASCSNSSCNSSMGRYYCKICKLFDDEREIYHCPYCNLCRVGKGLGIDYFHCMKCNACMSRTIVEHVCREKCLEDNCPICHEYIFTSNSPVKALPCGHVMHSTCFQEYTCSHYTCPICSKSLGDMQVYFRMLDALLAEQKMPDEYSNQTQVILCNDCGRKGNAPYHWLYHKCSFCFSYNTRLF